MSELEKQKREEIKWLEQLKKHCLCRTNMEAFFVGGYHPNLGAHPDPKARWLTPAEMIDAVIKRIEALDA